MTQKPITVFSDSIVINALSFSLEKFGLLDVCHLEKHDENTISIVSGTQKEIFTPPVRIGKIIDQIEQFKNKAQRRETASLSFGSARLDIHQGAFQTKSGENITLTEKEVEILAYLHDNKGRIISREELLEAVWNYAKDVETHTLETHIYRLRKKIESNPAEPTILKTEDNGYCV